MRLRALALACVAAWVGVVAFFSFVVAPLVFRTVDRAAAGLAVSAVLPHYYRWGVVLTVVALVAYLVAAAREAGGRLIAGVAAALCAVMVAMLAWAPANAVSPPARRAASALGSTTSHAHASIATITAHSAAATPAMRRPPASRAAATR